MKIVAKNKKLGLCLKKSGIKEGYIEESYIEKEGPNKGQKLYKFNTIGYSETLNDRRHKDLMDSAGTAKEIKKDEELAKAEAEAQAEAMIHLPEQAVTDAGVDIDLSALGGWEKEDDAKNCYHFVIINKTPANPVFVSFDGVAASIDTTDADNSSKTYQVILNPVLDRIAVDGTANAISLKCATGISSEVYMIIK